MYTCIHRHIYTYTHIHIHICMDIYIYTYAYICTYTYMYIHMHMHICIYTSPHSCMRACTTVQRLLCHGSYCELILSLARTSSKLSFPPALLPLIELAALLLARCPTCSLKKSVQIHASSWRGRRCTVAQASSDHPRWCGPHPVCLWFTLAHGRGSHPRQKFIFAAIFVSFVELCSLKIVTRSLVLSWVGVCFSRWLVVRWLACMHHDKVSLRIQSHFTSLYDYVIKNSLLNAAHTQTTLRVIHW